MTSGSGLGLKLKAHGFFVTPEETQPPPELQGLEGEGDESPSPLWVQALLSPYVQAVHLSMVRHSPSNDEPVQSLLNLRERLIREGPLVINGKEKLRLLWDGGTVFWLHEQLWSRPLAQLHPSWTKLQAECGKSRLLTRYLTTK